MPEVIVGALALVGVLVANWVAHRHWTAEQDRKRDEIIATQQAQRRQEAEEAARERREEQRDILAQMSEQNNVIIENAVALANEHRVDAQAARHLAAETAGAHAECRQEVATLSGKVEELRARMTETERTSGYASLVSEHHQKVKHMALNGLAAAEGYMSLVDQLAGQCECHALDPIRALRDTVKPRLDAVLEENLRIANEIPQPPQGVTP